MRFGTVVLAAGEGSRFGGHKLLAPLKGRPLLQHVLDVVANAGSSVTVVVLGTTAEEIEGAVEWRSEQRVVNPDPSQGLSSSLKLGLDTLLWSADAASLDAILVALGDQPRTSVAVIHALVETETDRPVVVPQFAEDGARNPVLLHPQAWGLAATAKGDRGLGALLDAHPDLVLHLPMPGANADVDTPDDLRALEDDSATEVPSGV